MNAISTTPETNDMKINVKLKLSALWITLMLLYIYADIFSLFRPGTIESMSAGRMGPFPATQGSLFAAALLMVIPAVMVALSITLKRAVNRWVNIILGALYTLVGIGTLLGEVWAYYILFVVLEMALTCLIAWTAWKWRDTQAAAA